ncbi:MAG: FAD-dependent oxidoreductase [Methanomassiliicoccales archaeon]
MKFTFPNGSNPEKIVLIVGAGVAGLSAARTLLKHNVKVIIVEKSNELGGKIRNIKEIFTLNKSGAELLESIKSEILSHSNVKLLLNSKIYSLKYINEEDFEVEVHSYLGDENEKYTSRCFRVNAVILAMGLTSIDAQLIPEMGYKHLQDVVVSLEFEELFKQQNLKRLSDGGDVNSLAFVQCVGSRVESRGVPYCSSVCCMNTIKNALAIKKARPQITVYVFYIDIRTHGKCHEELYKEAREAGVLFIRGLPSLVLPNPGKSGALVCGENTLLGELYEIPVDLVVLSVGLRQHEESMRLFKMLNLPLDKCGFPLEKGGESECTMIDGIFMAGCVEAPKDVRDSILQGKAAATAALSYFKTRTIGSTI